MERGEIVVVAEPEGTTDVVADLRSCARGRRQRAQLRAGAASVLELAELEERAQGKRRSFPPVG